MSVPSGKSFLTDDDLPEVQAGKTKGFCGFADSLGDCCSAVITRPPAGAVLATVSRVRHATPEDLEELDDLLRRLRAVDGLVEKKPGVFYRRSRAFLHFHADPSGLFADVRLGEGDFERRPVTSRADQRTLLADVRAAMGERAPT